MEQLKVWAIQILNLISHQTKNINTNNLISITCLSGVRIQSVELKGINQTSTYALVLSRSATGRFTSLQMLTPGLGKQVSLLHRCPIINPWCLQDTTAQRSLSNSSSIFKWNLGTSSECSAARRIFVLTCL